MDYSIFDDHPEDPIEIFEMRISLAEKRRANKVYIPEEVYLPEYTSNPDDLEDILRFFPDHVQKIPNRGRKLPPEMWNISGREVGDDRVECSNSPEASALVLTVQESVLGMRTSTEDTGITNDLWNFCEVSTGLPCSRNNMFNAARKSDNFTNLEFSDSPPIRTVIDTTKIDRIHSTSYKGKAKILGAKLRSCNTICSSYLSVANLFQDACLAVWKGADPKYLPNSLGGCHCVDSYGDYINTFLFMKAFRGGGYDRLYGTAVQESIEAIRLTESGKPTPCIVSEILRDDDVHAFATFANFVAIPDSSKFVESRKGIPGPIYERAGVRNEVAAVEARLVQAKRLLPRSQALVEIDKATRINDYLFSRTDFVGMKRVEREESLARRKQFDNALRGNTAFMRLYNRTGHMDDITHLFKEGWKPCVTGAGEFSTEHARWLSQGGKGEYLSLFDIPLTQDMYLREEVSIDETLKVGGIVLEVAGSSGWKTQTTVSKVGLYEISKTMEEWCDDKIDKLILKREEKEGKPLIREDLLPIFLENREWVNDDSLLIEKAIVDTESFNREAQVVLVSEDKRLANQMSRQANCTVVLVDPSCLPKVFPSKVWNSEISFTTKEMYEKYPTNKVKSRMLREPVSVYIDTGSLHAVLSKLTEQDGPAGERRFYRRILIESGYINGTGKRYEKFKKENIFFTSQLLITKVFEPMNKDPFKRPRQAFGRDSASASNYSWNRGDTLHITKRVTRRGGRGTASAATFPT